ncbi:MAG: N-acetylmuramoyl-L-alanine amidase [Roseiflexaceae bacterium]
MSEAFEIQHAAAPTSASTTRRKALITLIVLHDDPRPAGEARAAFTAQGAVTAPHYSIDAAGSITQFVPESRAARHSGSARWNRRRRNIDRISIGIALERRPDAPYADALLIALHQLLDQIEECHKLSDTAIVRWAPADTPGEGKLTHTLPPLPLVDAPVVAAPLVLGEEGPDYGLWVFLQGETYRQRGGNFKYTLNDLAHSQAFPIYATQRDLGAPVASNDPTPVLVNNVSYNYQPFARALVFNEGRNFAAVQNLNDQLDNVVPDAGASRALLEASYRASLVESKKHVSLQGREEFREDWTFHVVAMRSRLGPALGGNYATADGRYAVQVFAGDTLYTPTTDQAGCLFLSQTEPSDPAYQPIWIETYKICGTPYDANAPFQQRAAQDRLGTPLTGVYSAQYNGTPHQIQVFALDTLYAGPDGQIKRMSALDEPADIKAWKPATATPPPQPTPPPKPSVVVSPTPVRDPNWPPFPSFGPLPNRAARDAAFGHFEFTRGAGRSINIEPSWVQANIKDVPIPQLKSLWRGGRVQCHLRVEEQLKALWAAWESAGLLHLVLTYNGDWAPRVMAGNSNEVSMHAYGAAFDINVQWNQFNVRAALVGDKGSVRELAPIANQLGFYWGGHFRYNKHSDASDGMHFEWARPQ